MLSTDDFKQIAAIIKKEVDPLRQDVGSLKQDMKVVKKKVSKIEKTLDVAIIHFDREDVVNKKRLTRIENHLGITP